MAYELKITNNLAETKFKFETEDFVFHFSREFNLNRYKKKYIENRKTQKYKLQAMYGVTVEMSQFFDVVLYLQIEKVGTYIINKKDGAIIQCQDLIILDGQTKMLKELSELFTTTTEG